MKKSLILFIAIFGLVSFQTKNKHQTVTVQNKYSISIPAFLTKTNDLNEDASLEYENQDKELYVVVIDESKDEFHKALEEGDLLDIFSKDLKGLTSIILEDLDSIILNSKKSEIIDTKINNLPAKFMTISGSIDGINIFYSVAFIEGKDQYYQIISWTVAEKEAQYKNEMKRMIDSFKEL